MRCSLWRHLLRWLVGGLLYGLLEIAYRGHTHWTMVLLAALLCIPLDLANEVMPWRLPLALQGVIGGLTITAAGLLAGLGVKCWVGVGVWGFFGLWGKLLGEVFPLF